MAYRDYVRGPALRELLSRPHVRVILVQSEDMALLPDDLKETENLEVKVCKNIAGFSRLCRNIYSLIKDIHVLEHPENSFSIRTRLTSEDRGSSLPIRLALFRFLSEFGLRKRHIIAFLQTLGRYPEFKAILEEYRPDVVCYATMLPGKLHAVVEARRLGIPLALTVPTWDQPTSKGPLTVTPDHMLVWSQRMQQDTAKYHGLSLEKLHRIGVLYFDAYFNEEGVKREEQAPAVKPNITRDEFCQSLGLDPSRKIIQYAMAPPATIKCGLEFIHVLHRIITAEDFPVPAQLLVRVSPKEEAELYEPFKKLPHLFVQKPEGLQHPELKRWLPAEDEAQERINTLAHSDIVATIQSTMVLDSCCMGTPVVNLAYDAGLEMSELRSVNKFFRYDHAKPVLESGCSWVVKDHEQLREALIGYLQNPDLHAPERESLVRNLTTHQDGQTYRRWVDQVLAIAEG